MKTSGGLFIIMEKRKTFSNVAVRKEVHDKLKELKEELELRSLDSVINYLIQKYLK
ncbi:hypothetical protein LCGC14_1544140 [marine sediment metagenome]|uniref:Uncharacterized protein n=1 Tax=marine sediment metagenome TaxID=412755 RepID=A0A0F9LSX9_9ZZZZ